MQQRGQKTRRTEVTQGIQNRVLACGGSKLRVSARAISSMVSADRTAGAKR